MLFILPKPLLRDAFEKNPNMTKDEAKNLVVDCLKVLFYRDGRSFNKVLWIGLSRLIAVKLKNPSQPSFICHLLFD